MLVFLNMPSSNLSVSMTSISNHEKVKQLDNTDNIYAYLCPHVGEKLYKLMQYRGREAIRFIN